MIRKWCLIYLKNSFICHLSTAHRWRHRFLAAPKTVQPQTQTGAEADKTMFLLSFKGKRSGLDRKARNRGGKATQRAYHSRLKAWVQKLRGLAMCYLANYLGWFRALDREKGNGPKPSSGWLWRSVKRSNNMICEQNLKLYLTYCLLNFNYIIS